MNIYFAPLEGITGYLFRQTYEKYFGGIDRYYAPFVTMRDGGYMKKKEKWDIAPENNPGYQLVPQIMTNQADAFCQAARHMEEMGYDEVNLNLGCPSGTVTAKNRGAGFLRNPDDLDRFFDTVFAHSPIAISVKSRIGYYEEDEFYRLLDIYNQYPIKELILHPRTREDLYRAPVHREIFSYAAQHSKNPLCYNGDICSLTDVEKLKKEFPDLKSIMIGRGFLMRPGFIRNSDSSAQKSDNFPGSPDYFDTLYHFVTELQQRYTENFSGETPVLFKMKELWSHLKMSVPDSEGCFKKIKKTKKLSEYNRIVREILVSHHNN